MNSYLILVSLFYSLLTAVLVNISLNVNDFLHTTKYYTSGTSQMASFTLALLNIKAYNPVGKAASIPARKRERRRTLKLEAYTASALKINIFRTYNSKEIFFSSFAERHTI